MSGRWKPWPRTPSGPQSSVVPEVSWLSADEEKPRPEGKSLELVSEVAGTSLTSVARRRSVAGTNPRGPRRVNPSASGPGSPVWDTVAHCRWGHAGCFRILRGMCRDPLFQRDGDLRNHNPPGRDTVSPGAMQKSAIPYWASLASLHGTSQLRLTLTLR